MKKILFLFVFAITAYLAQAQVSEGFEGGSLCSGFLKCWTHDDDNIISQFSYGNGYQSICDDPGNLSLNTTSPINGNASLRISFETQVNLGQAAEDYYDYFKTTAYGADGNAISLKFRLSDIHLDADVYANEIKLILKCGSFTETHVIDPASVGTTVTINTTITGSGGGGLIEILLVSTISYNHGDPNMYPPNGYVIDIDDFSTDAGLDMTNSCVTTVLPVSFNDVKATLKRGSLSVMWATATEVNNNYFAVELSSNGKDYQEIGKVSSKAKNGNSSTPILYSFSHQLYSAATTYAGTSIIGLLLLSSLLMFVFKNRITRTALLLVIASSIGMTIACNKNEAVDNSTKADKFFVRIAQVNKDGTKSYSKVFQVVEEGK